MFIKKYLAQYEIVSNRALLAFLALILLLTVPALFEGGKSPAAQTGILLGAGILALIYIFSQKISAAPAESTKRISLVNPLTISFGALVLVKLFSQFTSVEPYTSFFDFLLFIAYAVIFVHFAPFAKIRARELILNILILFAIILSAIGILFFLRGSWPKLVGTFYWHNAFAGFISMFLPIIFAKFFSAEKHIARILWGAGNVLALSALFFTYSRGAMLALLIILPFFIASFKTHICARFKGIVALLILVIASILAISYGKSHTLAPSQADLLKPKNPLAQSIQKSQGTADVPERNHLVSSTQEFRLRLWESIPRMIFKKPILGVGGDNFKRGYILFAESPQIYAQHAHNLYLETAAELGVIGLLALCGWIFFVFKNSYVHAFRSSQTSHTAKALFYGLLIFFLHNGIDTDWYYPSIFMTALFFIAFINQSMFHACACERGKTLFPLMGTAVLSLLFIAFSASNYASLYFKDQAAEYRAVYHIPEALAVSKKSLEFNPFNFENRFLFAQDNYQRAVLEKKDRDLKTFFFARAEEEAQKTIREAPLYSPASFLLGEIYRLQKKIPSAKERYEYTIAINPFHKKAYLQLSTIFLKQNRSAETIAVLAAPLRIFTPEYYASRINPEQLLPEEIQASARLYNLRAIAYAQMKNKDAAKKDLNTALALSPAVTLFQKNLEILENAENLEAPLSLKY
ncbi:MAG: O-antigen polymerase [Parcubacteria group bacterium GW2011_GWA2_44_12]|nr:MAG: O-antigen polymerase [Parcubacteria group bacterium GW2011_GWA2_44_12]